MEPGLALWKFDLLALQEEFAREGVEHVVIGGYAFAFHGEPRD
jgi:hypothetical protein